jgi:hypothetical protein
MMADAGAPPETRITGVSSAEVARYKTRTFCRAAILTALFVFTLFNPLDPNL